MAKTKFVGTVIDPWVLNTTAHRVFLDDSVGVYIEPLFVDIKLKD
jgi:hypothetical protein